MNTSALRTVGAFVAMHVDRLDLTDCRAIAAHWRRLLEGDAAAIAQSDALCARWQPLRAAAVSPPPPEAANRLGWEGVHACAMRLNETAQQMRALPGADDPDVTLTATRLILRSLALSVSACGDASAMTQALAGILSVALDIEQVRRRNRLSSTLPELSAPAVRSVEEARTMLAAMLQKLNDACAAAAHDPQFEQPMQRFDLCASTLRLREALTIAIHQLDDNPDVSLTHLNKMLQGCAPAVQHMADLRALLAHSHALRNALTPASWVPSSGAQAH